MKLTILCLLLGTSLLTEFCHAGSVRRKKTLTPSSDVCYQVFHKESEPAPVRGLEKTLVHLEKIASSREGGWASLKLPPSFEKSLANRTHPSDNVSTTVTDNTFLPCPKAESIFPCICDELSLTINCSATGNFTQIREIFTTTEFRHNSFNTFLLYGYGVTLESETALLNNTFGSVTFKKLLIESTNLRQVEETALAGSEDTLEIIKMEHNPFLNTFPFSELHHYSKLTELKLSFGKLERLPSLGSVPKLETIFLESNSIRDIDSYAFANLPALMTVDLGRNKLGTIQAHDFAFSSPEVFLYIDENIISNIEDEAFSGEQPSLLDLYFNQMVTLNTTVFQPIFENIIEKQYDSYVDAEENPLCCDAIHWILTTPIYYELITLPDLQCPE